MHLLVEKFKFVFDIFVDCLILIYILVDAECLLVLKHLNIATVWILVFCVNLAKAHFFEDVYFLLQLSFLSFDLTRVNHLIVG